VTIEVLLHALSRGLQNAKRIPNGVKTKAQTCKVTEGNSEAKKGGVLLFLQSLYIYAAALLLSLRVS